VGFFLFAQAFGTLLIDETSTQPATGIEQEARS
jgi:hypothetical protein